MTIDYINYTADIFHSPLPTTTTTTTVVHSSFTDCKYKAKVQLASQWQGIMVNAVNGFSKLSDILNWVST